MQTDQQFMLKFKLKDLKTTTKVITRTDIKTTKTMK